MKIRPNTFWRVPIFCIISSWISYYVTVMIGGFFFTVKTVGADGVIEVSADPLRSAIFNGILFVIVLLIGGLWAFRNMSKPEIAISATIISAIYLAITIAQMCITDMPVSVGVSLARFQNWTGIVASFFLKLTNSFNVSVLLANFAPFLFVIFGKKSNK